MRTKRCTVLVAAWLAVGAFPACDHVGSGSSDGGVTDTDVDTESDTESCAEILPYCCTGECPCAEAGDRCVTTYGGGVMDALGVCKPETSGGECWITEDCAEGEFCAGAFVCPCDADCSWEGPGICAPVSGACCEDASAVCPDDYTCLALDGTDTCHGMLTYPQCWTDEECFGAAPCVDAVLCACDVDCVSVPGICWMYEYK